MFRSKIMRLRYSGGGDRGYGEINWGFETTCDISSQRERERGLMLNVSVEQL